MHSFKAPVDDILFSLRHVAQVNKLDSWDDTIAEDVLGHFAEFAQNVLAPINASGDREGARLVNGRVQMPTGFVNAYKQLSDDGWQGVSMPEQFGGNPVSPLVVAGITEIFAGANHSMQMICSLAPGAIATLHTFGSTDQQAQWIPKLATGEYLSTMCLTEPAAGSDLSVITCQAKLTDSGWVLNGEKCFISGGDQNLSSHILHLVLARSEKKDSGLDGLSLFLCPSQSGVSVTRIEKKMGLNASPTCQMLFENASVELVGERGGGLTAMFKLMNEVRIDVALQGVAHAAHAFLIAANYAANRTQGRRSDGKPAKLADHADVRRMLDIQRCLALGTRAMCHVSIKEIQLGSKPALVEFLTSLCKVVGSEAGTRSANLGIQVLGGYGYLEEYGLSQIWRDARITSIYEGANGIHKRNLVTRGLRPNGCVEQFATLMRNLANRHPLVNESVDNWLSVANALGANEDAVSHAHEFTRLTAQVFHKAVWVRMAATSNQYHDTDELRRLSSIVLDANSTFSVL